MMGSSNLDHYHHQHQDDTYASTTSSSTTTSSFLAAAAIPVATAAAAPALFGPAAGGREWNQNLILNYGDFMSSPNIGYLQSSQSVDLIRPLSHEASPIPPRPTFDLQSIQEVGFHWNTNGNAEGQLLSNPLHQATRIKDEQLPAETFTKFGGLVRNSCSNEDLQIQEKLFPRTLASDCQMSSNASTAGLMLQELLVGNDRAAENLSMVFPTPRIPSNLSGGPQAPLTFSYDSIGGMDPHHHLGLLPPPRVFDRSSSETSAGEMLALIQETVPYGHGLCHLPRQDQALYYRHHKMPSLVSGVTDQAKRGDIDTILGHKSSQTAPKRTRFEQRSSFSPFKVRKEKLGDRIAALQQLVAPFGKTDTASVLMEAIGYIKFLQDQVETLSVPYMRSSGNAKRLKTTQKASNGEGEEPKLDLRSRGLCLVPLSCTSYVTSEHIGAWSSSDYGGSG